MNYTAESLRQFVRDNFLFGQEITFSDDSSFLEQGLIDSTGVLELVAFLEQRFSIAVGDEELAPENLDSIDNLVRFVESKLAGSAGTLAGEGSGAIGPIVSADGFGPLSPISAGEFLGQ